MLWMMEMRRTLVALAILMVACGSTVQVDEPGSRPASDGAPADGASHGLALDPEDGPTVDAGAAQDDAGFAAETGGSSAASDVGTSGGTSAGGTDGTSTQPEGPGPSEPAPGPDGEAESDTSPLRIGVIVPEGNAGSALGASLAFEDYRRIAEALVTVLNEEGGIAGRPIEAEIREASQNDQSQENQTQQAQAICASLTQDTQVHLVVADGTTGTQWALDCYADADTPVLLPSSLVDDKQVRDLRPWVLPYPLHTIDRVARELPRVLGGQGALTDSIGILAYDLPDTRRVVEKVLKPTIERQGGTVLETVYMAATYQDVSAQTSSAVLRFKTQGIDFVIPGFASGGGVTGIFMHEAESQNYRPNYGLSSLDVPVVVDDVMGAPPAQMANSVGMGYLPAHDVPQSQYPPTAREQECWDVVNGQLGTSYSQRSPTASNGYAAIQLCELFWLVDTALDPAAGRAFGSSDVIGFVEALGEGYRPVQLPQARFAAGRPDGAAVQRVFGFDAEGCSCFTYTADWTTVS